MSLSHFSQHSVWSQETRTGFKQQVLVMYHGTSAENAERILEEGFHISTGQNQMLGNGIYLSKNMVKTRAYGDVTLRLLVYPGRVTRVDRQDHPRQKTWQSDYGTAWVPKGCGMVQSGLEENCIKSTWQVKVIGVCRGWNNLSYDAKLLTRNCCSRRRPSYLIGEDDELDLQAFVRECGLQYSKVSCGAGYLSDNKYDGGAPRFVPEYNDNDGDHLYWTVSWDGCLENKKTGRVLMMKEDRRLVMSRYEEGGRNARYQKWKLDARGGLVSRYFKEPIHLINVDDEETWYDHRSKFTPFRRGRAISDDSDYNSGYDSDDSDDSYYYS